jgi:hypothetical protein
MITIGYSTRKPNPEFQEKIKKSIGLKEFTIIEKINNGEKSLTQVYNEILEESKTDIIVLCHDDLIFETEKWGKKVLNHFNNTEFGIIGVAGTTSIPESGRWWEDPSKMVGIVNHKHEGKKWESKYSKNWGDEIIETILVDGLFISLSKNRIKNKFNSNIPDFHFYDVDFSFKNHLLGVKVGVMFDVRLTHLSIGMTNDKWESNRELFVSDVKENLPYYFEPNIEIINIPFYKSKPRINILLQSQGDVNQFNSLYDNIKSFNIDNIIFNIIVNEDKLEKLKSIEYPDVKITTGYFDSLSQNLSILKWDSNFIEDDDLVFIMNEDIKIMNDIFSSFSKIYYNNKKSFGCGFPISINKDNTLVSFKLDVIQSDNRVSINFIGHGTFYNLNQGMIRHQLGTVSPVMVTTKQSLIENDWLKMNYSTEMLYNDFAVKCLKYNKECIVDTNSIVKSNEVKTLSYFSSDYQHLFNTLMEDKKSQTLIKK